MAMKQRTERFFVVRLLAYFIGVAAALGALFALGILHGIDALGYGALLLAGRELMLWGNAK